ncbi:hypothetical protein BGW38_005743 [Lunasporangiospora selenospora]|uniref:RNA ligase domain-containing protein n=1 Tax=Lunasporangiospora selenospora TaxID=979761 RepID=A0A9P6FML7_9FUNG|nr:hypothetical protein BGW38_005743 [Lunasporangiospora selenospora]
MNADQAQHQAKARPAFIPPSVLQRKRTNVGGGAEGTSPRSPTAGSMDRVIEEESEGEEEDEEEEEEDPSEERVEEEEEDDDHDDGVEEVEDGNEGERIPSPTAAKDKARAEKDQRIANSICGALRFASPTGHRPAVKKPERGSWKRPGSGMIDQVDKESQPSSPKGVSFAANMVSYDRPLQKFPRTPHLFDPLTIHKNRPNVKVERDVGEESLVTGRQSAAISRNDLLLPVSALDQILTPKPHQVLTVEEKLDGANIGFSGEGEGDVKVGSEGDKDEDKNLKEEEEDDEDGEEEEYMDETMVLQDGMAPYVLYGEWMFAKHSVEYTGLRSWFIPFDLFDVKTGTFVSRAIFRNAIAQTQLVANPSMGVPVEVAGDVDRIVEWLLAQLQSRSKCMRDIGAEGSDPEPTLEDKERVEGLYFRVDQGDRLLLRAKVVRPDFIAGEERWGMKEQRANKLRHDAHYAGMCDDEDEVEVEDDDEDE